MDKILAQRFAPFNFSIVPGFLNVVPIVDEWGDYFPIFKRHRDELIHQWEIPNKDVLMKMFMFSLVGDAR